MVGSKGSECHFSMGPAGTTSVCPARTTRGFALPWRMRRFATSPHLNTSALKPRGTSRSMMSCWHPASSGVTDLRAMSAFASSRVSFFKSASDGAIAVDRGAVAARERGTHSLFDVAAQPGLRAEKEEGFRADEERPDDELHHVVVERGLHAFVPVAEKLQGPARNEDRRGEPEHARRRGARGDLARGRAHREEHGRNRDAERDILPQVVGARGDGGDGRDA